MYVYFIQCDNQDGYIKIGKSNNPKIRKTHLQISTPYKLKLLAKVKFSTSKKSKEAESFLHKKFKDYHVNGEWYDSSIYWSAVKSCLGYRNNIKDIPNVATKWIINVS